jgi:hypothetical protein
MKSTTTKPSNSSLRALEGGREALERAYMWAIIFDRPDKQALARRLEPSANDSLCVVRQDEDEPAARHRSSGPRA